MIHTLGHEVEIGVFIWSGNFIDLDRLLKCIHKSYVSPATIPGASWDRLHIGLKVKTFTELEACWKLRLEFLNIPHIQVTKMELLKLKPE